MFIPHQIDFVAFLPVKIIIQSSFLNTFYPGVPAALSSRLTFSQAGKDGQPIDLGPCRYARLTAVDRFIMLLAAGRPVPKAVEMKRGDGTMTLAELGVLVGENPAGSHFLGMSQTPGTPTM